MKIFEKTKLLKAGLVLAFGAMFGIAIANLSARENHQHAMRDSQAKQGDVVKGANLWAKTCQRCHNMRDPGELDDKQWKTTVTHMRIRAGLTGQDARDVLAFLQQSNGK